MVVRNLLQRGLLLGLSLVALGSLALALEPTAAAQEPANGNSTLKVAPLRSDLTMDPGETRTVKVTVTNPTASELTVRPVQNDFIAEDEKGNPAIILDEGEFAPKHSLKRFMTPIDNLVLPANGSISVDVELVVPANAQPGGYFGAVRFDPVDQSSGGQVNLNTSIASLILLRVSGDAPERLTLSDFEIQQKGRISTWYMDDKDLSMLVRFENSGMVQLRPVAKLSILRGDEVVYDEDFNNKEQKEMILPDSARRWDVALSEVGGFGKYTAVATFTYGSKNQIIEVESSFWIIPRAVIVGGIVGILTLIAAIVGLVVYIRSRGSKTKTPRGRAR